MMKVPFLVIIGKSPRNTFCFLDLTRPTVYEPGNHIQRLGVTRIALFGFLDGHKWFPEEVIAEIKTEGTGEVLYRRQPLEDLAQSLFEKPLERFFLDRDQVGQVQNFGDLRERQTLGSSNCDQSFLLKNYRTGPIR